MADLEPLVTLRTLAGYLGEREHFDWWPSAFFAPGSDAFLAPLFARTRLLARCSGVTQAAALVHDERIGVGHVYHLFRLPEDLEQGIHHLLNDEGVCGRVETLLLNQEAALAALRGMAGPLAAASPGPARVGATSDVHRPDVWSVVAAHYLHAFEHGARVYPYFTDNV